MARRATSLKALPQAPARCCTPLTAPRVKEEEAEATATLFKALCDPNRVKIVNLLANSADPVCVCDITATLRLSQPTVSFHLKKLTTAGVLQRHRRGVWAFYSVDRDALRRLADVFGGMR